MARRELPVLGPAPGATARAGSFAREKAVEPDDPLELVGVPVPVDEATFDEMARCLVEEYVRDGWTDERLLALFHSPFYAGLHVIERRRGVPWVRELIAATRARWQRPDPAGRPDPVREAR